MERALPTWRSVARVFKSRGQTRRNETRASTLLQNHPTPFDDFTPCMLAANVYFHRSAHSCFMWRQLAPLVRGEWRRLTRSCAAIGRRESLTQPVREAQRGAVEDPTHAHTHTRTHCSTRSYSPPKHCCCCSAAAAAAVPCRCITIADIPPTPPAAMR
jgi:hypothetical protein